MALNNSSLALPVARLIEQFHRLPGIGPKMAQRIAYYLVRTPQSELETLAEAILSMKLQIVFCGVCQNIADSDPCGICSDPGRDSGVICVVQDPMDAHALEKTGVFKGQYHVLHGVLDPMNRIGPREIRLAELLSRLEGSMVREIVLATSATVEGEATAMYVQESVKPSGVKVTRLARGLPVGGDLEYADELTLTRALEGRREV